jgi:hypothetical protein
MKATVQPFVLIPRYTSYVGENVAAEAFVTVPLDVSRFSLAVLTFWRGPLTGSGAGFSATFQTSHDADSWFNAAAAVTSVDTCTKHEIALERRWLRVKIELSGTDAAISCWATGSLEERLD